MTELDPSTEELARALRAPATATELQDEERYLAMFREANGTSPAIVRSLPRRAIGRLGAGGTAVVVTVALTSGVAAAYTGHLPDPVQQLAHTVIGAPAPDTSPPHHHRPAAERPGTRLAPLPTSSGSASPGSPGPSAPPSPSSGATPARSPTSTGSAVGHQATPTAATDGPSASPTPSPSASGAASAVPWALT
ncbi:MAG: hypothetical protein WAV00_16945, partial [Nocardioides sp.]